MPLQPVLLDKPLALALRDLARQAIPPLSFASQRTPIDRAPGARLCYVEMVAPEEDSDLNAEVLLSVCGYNPGDRLLVEAQAGISVPTVGQKAWVIWVANPTEEVNGEHCPPHWVTFDGGGCPNRYVFEHLFSPSGGTSTVELYGTYKGVALAAAMTAVIPWDAMDSEIKTLLETANGYDPLADPVTGFPVTVSNGPLGLNAVTITLPAGVKLRVTVDALEPSDAYPYASSCCGA